MTATVTGVHVKEASAHDVVCDRVSRYRNHFLRASADRGGSQVCRIDDQLDRLQLQSTVPSPSSSSSPTLQTRSRSSEESEPEVDAAQDARSGTDTKRVEQLQNTLKALSTGSSSQPLLSSTRLLWLLEHADLSSEAAVAASHSPYEKELEWLLVGKATVQTYGLILDSFLNHIIPLSDDIWYWDEVLGSYFYSGLYMLQTSPLRAWGFSKEIYGEAMEKMSNMREKEASEVDNDQATGITASLSVRWQQFYGLVRQSVHNRRIGDLQSKMITPITKCRIEARRKQRNLRKLREMSASGLGVLMDEGLSFDTNDSDSEASKPLSRDRQSDEWKSIVAKSVSLMETVLQNVTTLETTVHDFEDIVFTNVENDPEGVHTEDEELFSQPTIITGKLKQILQVHLPNHAANTRKLAHDHGRPSRIIRYWPAATVLLLSSTTLLRIFVRRKAEIIQWIRDLGDTTRDFWFNWVVEPVKKVIGTIRHDKDSEIAIMSKESLEGDRASLERMVVDFAVDNPEGGSKLSEAQITDLRTKVKEGDLTPVLKAYEQDLRKPFAGTIRGNLIRALLIQIQKTKVDVEVAMGGIDALLKSQELVFG